MVTVQYLLNKYPDRIPCIIEYNEKIAHPSYKTKFLVPSNITFGTFIYILRKNIKLTPEKAIFVFVNKNLIPSSMSMTEVYCSYKATDGFLRCVVDSENTFG